MANSIQLAVSDGTLVLLNLSIDYFDRTEIKVFFNSVEAAEGSGWAWVGTTQKSISFSPAVPNGTEVLVKRTTDMSKLRHEFSAGAAFAAMILDEDLKQVLHIAQEASESNLSGEFFVDINMHNKKITNLAAAIDPADALTKGQFDTALGTALADSAAATAAATSAASSANSAATSANAAATAANALGSNLADTSDVSKGANLIGYAGDTLRTVLRDKTMHTVDTFAALRATSKLLHTRTLVLGKSAPGDGGYGEYYYDSTDSTTADDDYFTIVGTDGGRWKRIRLKWQTATKSTDGAVNLYSRQTSHTGGTPGVTASALSAATTVVDSGVTNFEWTFLSTMDSYATAGENVAVYGQAKKRAQGAVWAACFEIQDLYATDPAQGAALGIEVTCVANNSDTNLLRNGVNVVAGRVGNTGTDCEWGRGFWTSNGTNSRYVEAFSNTSPFKVAAFKNSGDASAFAGSATLLDVGKATNGIDLTGATYTGSALRLAAGQSISFDSSATVKAFESAGRLVLSGGRVQMSSGFYIPASGNTAATATAGSSGATPAQVAGYLIFQIDGTNFKLPYYGV